MSHKTVEGRDEKNSSLDMLVQGRAEARMYVNEMPGKRTEEGEKAEARKDLN